jgi:glucose/arabinose dehydrogenase
MVLAMQCARVVAGIAVASFGIALGCNSGGGGNGSGSVSSGAACPEIFAYGFRNPWRMSFDPVTHVLYVGDVGQSAQEEIDIVTAGGNYGWDCMEGELSHPTLASCSGVAFVAPEVVHDRVDAKAITGGVVYRGAAIPDLVGYYVYGDFITQRFFEFDAETPNAPAQRVSALNAAVSAFGQGRDGEIYAVTFGSPSIRKIVQSGSGPAGVDFADAFPGRAFSLPVKLVQHPTNDHRWYVVEQGGLVKTFLDTDSAAPTIAATVPNVGGGGEQGLLSMAFDPGFAVSGEIYLTYTNVTTSPPKSTLARWVSTNGGLTFAPDTAPIVLAFNHPFTNHNGGDLAFGADGFLYYSMGDGGGADDPNDYGQNRGVLLGKILRLDVNSAPPLGKTYVIPAGNPYAGNEQCPSGFR